MTNHLHYSALQSQLVEREYSQKHKPKMANTTIRYKSFQIGLSKSQQCAVNYSDHSQRHGYGSHSVGRQGKQRQNEAYQPVSSCFQQQTRKYNASGSWSFRMCVRQPGVKRNNRDLNSKCRKKTQH